MSKLNPSQARSVAATFQYVDGVLSGAERFARGELSPLAGERADVAPDEGRLLLSSVAVARERMLAALDRLGIPRPQPKLSARWGIETGLKFAASALGELDTAHLRGYGAVDAEAARELEALAADLEAVLRRAVALLHERDAGGLAERLGALRGPAGEMLRALERLSTERGLADVRSLIAAAAERASSTTFDVGVFGRVSAGKSSLVNALAGTPVLPVGATPETAVPLRVRRGPLGAVVHLLDGDCRAVEVDQVAAYGTEEHNPQNQRGVREIEIQAPTVAEGLRFLDTPGVGSLATSGPAQAFAWLPRCDLGLVLVAAGGPVGPDDVALVAGLTNAGIACRVLLSKSDLLPPDERDRALAYVRRELATGLGGRSAVEVEAVSALAACRDQLEELQLRVLEPLAADHARAGRDALRRRLHSLVAATGAALAGRTYAPDDRFVERHAARLAAGARIRSEAEDLAGSHSLLLAEAAGALTAAWARGEDGSSAVRGVFLDAASRALAAVREAADALSAATPGDPTPPSLPPLFDAEFLNRMPDLSPPRLARWFPGRAAAARHLQPIAAALRAALERYAARLEAWGRARLEEHGTGFRPAEPADDIPEQGLLAELAALVERV